MDALKAESCHPGYTVTEDPAKFQIHVEGKVLEVFCDTYFTYSGRIRIELKAKQNGELPSLKSMNPRLGVGSIGLLAHKLVQKL